jgi:hypothetical protein
MGRLRRVTHQIYIQINSYILWSDRYDILEMPNDINNQREEKEYFHKMDLIKVQNSDLQLFSIPTSQLNTRFK